MRAIVAIGGGDIRRKGTLRIDREIIRLTGKKHPRLLFIPTASSDSESYWMHIQKYFGRYLHCETDVLYLLKDNMPISAIQKKIFAADIVYVGGGNTLKMMRCWRKLGVDAVLRTAHRKGKVLCGISAGSICWFDGGHSDSLSFYNPKNWKYICVKGLGILRGIHCPHYGGRTLGIPRRKHFQRMMKSNGGFGIAIEDNCAIAFVDDRYRVLSSKLRASAYVLHSRQGKVIARHLSGTSSEGLIASLYQKKI